MQSPPPTLTNVTCVCLFSLVFFINEFVCWKEVAQSHQPYVHYLLQKKIVQNNLLARQAAVNPSFNFHIHQVYAHVTCSLTEALTFKTAVDSEQPAECQRICYLIRSVPQIHRLRVQFGLFLHLIHTGILLYSYRHWIQEFWMMFRLHHSLSDSLDEFRDLIREHGQERLCSLLETKWM